MRARLFTIALIALPLFAVVVDRIAITVGSKVITDSEINQRIRLSAFQNGDVADFSIVGRRDAASQLIDQKLIEREMEIGHFELVTADETKEILTAFTAEFYHSDTAALQKALAGASLTLADLQAELAKQENLLSFLTLRFRPAVPEAREEDVNKYFHDHFDAVGIKDAVTLSQVRAGIEQILVNQQADRELDQWLNEQRKKITYLLKDLQ